MYTSGLFYFGYSETDRTMRDAFLFVNMFIIFNMIGWSRQIERCRNRQFFF